MINDINVKKYFLGLLKPLKLDILKIIRFMLKDYQNRLLMVDFTAFTFNKNLLNSFETKTHAVKKHTYNNTTL